MDEIDDPLCCPDACGVPTGTNAKPTANTLGSERHALVLDVFSDTICPWCLIALRRTERAITMIEGLQVELRWHAFQLNPEMPLDGMDRRAYRSAKFGSWERSLELDEQVSRAGEQDGICFRHDRMQRTPNTSHSHRLIHWAGQLGRQTTVVERLFTAYFCDGRDIGRVNVLIQIANELGLDADGFGDWFDNGGGVVEVSEHQIQAVRLGIRGVPTFVLGEQVLFSGAPDVNSLVSLLKQLASLQTGVAKGGPDG